MNILPRKSIGLLLVSLLTACSQNLPSGDNFYPKTWRGYVARPEVVLNRLAGKWTVQKRNEGKYDDLTSGTGLNVDDSSIGVTRTISVKMKTPELVGLAGDFTLDDNPGYIICKGCTTEFEGWTGHLLQ
jgi:hypothetical protein